MKHVQHRAQTPLDWIYNVGIAVKGFDGVVELVAGILLWADPGLLHRTLHALLGEAQESNSRMMQFVAEHVARIDADLTRSGLVFFVLFLILHGVVKVALVVALFAKWRWAYPWAIGALAIFLVYQVYAYIKQPSIAMAIFSLIDALIVWLVYKEYREISTEPVVEKVL